MGKIIFRQSILGTADLSQLPNDKLYAILSNQRLQYVVADHLDQPHYLSDFRLEGTSHSHSGVIKEAFAKDTILRSSFKNVLLLLTAYESVLTPSIIISKEKKIKNPLLRWGKGEVQLSDEMMDGEVEHQYKADSDLVERLKSIFPNNLIKHNTSCLITHFKKICSNFPGNRVFANILDDKLDILYFRDGELQFVNEFIFTNEEDFIYYILLIYNQFDLNPDNEILAIFGDTEKSKSHINMLKDYIRNIQFIQPQISFLDPSVSLSSTVKNTYYSLLSALASKII